MRAVSALAALGVTVLLLAGCTAPGAGTSRPASAAPVTFTMPSPAASACTPTTVGTSDMSLKLVSFTRLADQLRVRFVVNRISESFTQNISFAIIYKDADGSHGGILLSGKTAGDALPQVYEAADDSSAMHVLHVTPSFGQDGAVVTDYPSDLVKKLHSGWTWRAVVNLDGEDTGTCGDDG